MKNNARHTGTFHSARRILCRTGLAAALLLLPFSAGCGDEMSKAWREAALPELETGLRAVSDALITGFIELNTPDSSDDSTDTTSG